MNMHPEAFEYADQVIQSNKDTRTVIVGAELGDNQQLFAHYANTLLFPAHFGKNWDAFVDCMGDLGWLGRASVIVFHSALPPLDPASLRTYLECLRDAWQRHAAQKESSLRLVFASHLRTDIETLFTKST